MNTVVVYVSKSGNTKAIADYLADQLGADALPLNLITKKGRGTKEERDLEDRYFDTALASSKDRDLVVIGTPTSFKRAHSKALRFVKSVEAKHVALFCTYINKIGETLSGLAAILDERGIRVVGTLPLGNLNSGQFGILPDAEKGEYYSKTKEFALRLTSD